MQENEQNRIDWLSLIYDEKLLPFALGAAIVSILFLVVDYLYFSSQENKESMLGITYRGNNIWLILVTWFGGGFVVAYFATLIEIFDNSKQSMFALGLLWPFGFTKLVAGAKAHLLGGDEAEEPLIEEED